MAVVSRKDKLTGIRGIVGGALELAMAADRTGDPAYRRAMAGFGVTSVVVGIAEVRGAKFMRATGTGAGAAVAVRGIQRALKARRDATERVAAVRSPTAFPSGPLTRRERLRAIDDLVGGVASLAIAADRSLEPHERLATGIIGVSALAGGIGRLRRLQPAMAIAGTGYLVAIGAGVVTAARRRRG